MSYFSLEKLKGAAISLAVGILVYAFVARPWMTEREKDGGRRYPDRWPWWLDLENSIYRPLVLIALPAVCGFVGRVMDHAVDGLILLARKTTHRQTRERYKRRDGDRLGYLAGLACDDAALLFDRLTFRKRERRSAIPRMVEIEMCIRDRFMALFGVMFFAYQLGDLTFKAGGILGGLADGDMRNTVLLVSAVMIVGFGTKAGMFPMHGWLSTAHPAAPAPASAVLSGIITKSGVLALIRVASVSYTHRCV